MSTDPRNFQNVVIVRTRNCRVFAIYELRNCRNVAKLLVGPEIAKCWNFWAKKLKKFGPGNCRYAANCS